MIELAKNYGRIIATSVFASKLRYPSRLVAVVSVFIGVALRAAPLTQNRFHPDEALYATFARLIASGRDPLLAAVVVDKPPLPFYLMAASMSVFGGSEFAARLPAFFAGCLTVAILYRLALELYGPTTARFAVFSLACSPLAILFSITLFTDTLLAAGLFLSLLLAARRKWAGAGWAFGLAFASKQTALIFLPLIVVIGVLSFFHHREHRDKPFFNFSVFSVVSSFLIPVLICAAAVFLWDTSRGAPISYWTQGYTDNNPGRLARANELWPRWWAWLDLLQYFTGSPAANIILLGGLPLLLLFSRRSFPAVHDYIFTGFSLAFLAVYWLLAFNVWDRYLLILTPIAVLFVGRLLSVISRLEIRDWRLAISTRSVQSPISNPSASLRTGLQSLISLLLAASLLPPALLAARSGFPVGGDHGAYEGIDQIAQTLSRVPPESVVYDHWLSWELGFYLFDGPAYIAWMPGPGALTDDLKAFGRQSPRYIVSPAWESFSEMQAAIEEAGFSLEIIQQTYRRNGSLSFTLYQIMTR